MGTESKLYSYTEVSTHNNSKDCWVIINAKVYNVTGFLNDHPGGDDVLLAAAGKDASEEFEDVGHGSAARLMLDEFYVGEVDSASISPSMASTTNEPPATSRDSKDQPLTSDNKLRYFLIPFAILGVAVGYHFYK